MLPDMISVLKFDILTLLLLAQADANLDGAY